MTRFSRTRIVTALVAPILLALAGCGGDANGTAPADDSPTADIPTDVAATDATDVTVDPQACDEAHPDRTVGLLRCKPGQAGGYVLFPAKHRGDVFLIDKLGRVVNHWSKSTLEPGQSCYLRPNGNLVRAAMLKGASNIGGGEGGRIEEYDWNDNLVWAFDYASNDAVTHHDFTILPNGNLLMLAVERKSKEEAGKVGFDVTKLADGYVAPDKVIEVKKTGASSFEIVWEWHTWDHLVQNQDPALSNYGDPADHPELLGVKGGAPAFWNHVNSIGYNAELDQVILSARSHNEFWVIDHSTTTAEAASHQGGKRGKGGDFLYRWGNPVNYAGGKTEDRKLFNQHDAKWIEPGLPGAGNILLFNNGLDRPGPLGFYSTLDELTPAHNPDGSYTVPAKGQAWGPSTLVWQFSADPPTAFYSSEISGAQRLANGNTLACEGVKGHFFEVTPAGEVVWQYVNPVRTAKTMAQYELAPLDPKTHPENAVFKVHWYPADFAGFQGKDMTVKAATVETQDTACPTDNANYACGTEAACKANGGESVAANFQCPGGAVCCFKLTAAEPEKKP
ncbi:MAG: aryl-sulfate sulfotransferase [Myxococcota bacterium]